MHTAGYADVKKQMASSPGTWNKKRKQRQLKVKSSIRVLVHQYSICTHFVYHLKVITRRCLFALEGLFTTTGHGQFGHGQLCDLRPEERLDFLVGLLCAVSWPQCLVRSSTAEFLWVPWWPNRKRNELWHLVQSSHQSTFETKGTFKSFQGYFLGQPVASPVIRNQHQRQVWRPLWQRGQRPTERSLLAAAWRCLGRALGGLSGAGPLQKDRNR